MKKLQRWIGLAVAAAMAAAALDGCSRVSSRGPDDASGSAAPKLTGAVDTDGSASMEKVIGVLGEVFENRNAGVTFTYNPTGSGSGIRAVRDGRCDIGLSSRMMKDEEIADGLTGTVLAYDGIAMIVHPENPVSDLDMETIAGLYTGEIDNWRAVGGNDAPVVLIGREAGSGTRDGFESATGTAGQCRYRQELTSAGDVITTVARNPDAVGYASLSNLSDGVKVLSVAGAVPSEETIKNGSYAIRRPFILVTRTDTALSDAARAFFEFAVSPDAAGLIAAAGAVAAN